MKKQLLMLVLTLLPMVASAHDIEVKNADGVTIYYDYINNGTELEVSQKYYTGNIVIPEEVTYMDRTRKVTSIGICAFYNCQGLTSVTIPNSVTNIGGSAFQGCSNLTSITIPISVTSIGIHAFGSCTGLTSITIPNSVTSIGVAAFYNCQGLTSVSIPNSVTSIEGETFLNCTGLTSVTFPNSVMNIGYSAFYSCSSLTSITIPNSVTSIGNSAFDGCSSLTSVIIGNCVTSIGERTFNRCVGLTSVTIPNSVTSIGNYAFMACFGLTSVTVLNPTPVAITQDVFTNQTNAILYVPKGSKEAYQAADYWKEFKEIKPIEEESSKPVDYTVVNYNVDKMSSGDTYISDRLKLGIIENDLIQTLGISQEQFEANYSFDCHANIFTQYYMDDGVIKACSSQEANHNHANDELGAIKIFHNIENDYDSFIQWEVRGEEMSNYISNLGGNAANLRRYIKFHKTGSIDGPDDVYVSLSPGGLDDVSYPQCAKPTIAFQNGEILFGCETEGVEYVYTCTTPASTPQSTGRKFTPSTQYTIRVYAKKNGYLDSEPVTQEIDVRGLKGDVNDDGEVDIADAVKIVNLVVGKIDALSRPAKEVKDEKEPQ